MAVVKETPAYSSIPPYAPSESDPEWPGIPLSKCDNPAWRGVRRLLRYLALDAANYDTSGWNPLGELIRPGDTVVLKPNLVAHANIGHAFGTDDTLSLITHGSVIRAVADYVAKALAGRGTIVIGDCPLQGTEWRQVAALAGLPDLARHFSRSFPGVRLTVRDYRLVQAAVRGGWVSSQKPSDNSQEGYLAVDLGAESLLEPLEGAPRPDYGVSQYPRSRMRAAHARGRHSYVLARDLLSPDVFINLPKLKSHMKSGMTGALKNLVGLNGHKDHLPHFRFGSPKSGGDEYPDGNGLWDLMWTFAHKNWDSESKLGKLVSRGSATACAAALRCLGAPRHSTWLGGGSWNGNDTLWRTVLDLNRAFFYCDPASGRIAESGRPGLRYLAIVDGLIGGEGEGPLAPSPVPSGWLLGGFNPVAVDAVAAACIGFDYRCIRIVDEAFRLGSLPLAAFAPSAIRIAGNTEASTLESIYSQRLYTPFKPSQGFRGKIEFVP